jgi:hypothetical protein
VADVSGSRDRGDVELDRYYRAYLDDRPHHHYRPYDHYRPYHHVDH